MQGGYGGMGRARRGIPPVTCVCTRCGYEVAKTRGMPCRSMQCPKCNIPLVGK